LVENQKIVMAGISAFRITFEQKESPFQKVIPFLKYKTKNLIFVNKNKHLHDG